MEMVCVVCC